MEKPKILLVDDRKENLVALQAILEEPELDIMLANSGDEALALLIEHEFALVLLDVQMPGMDGIEIAEMMRRREKTKHTPIIFVTAINKEQQYVFKGYEKGAVDYLFKPLDATVLRSKVKVFLNLFKQNQSLLHAYAELHATLEELRQANKKILEDQRVIIEEERLRLLLQLAGATAYEMNQPLTELLTGIDLLKQQIRNGENFGENLLKISKAGETLQHTAHKIQTIHEDKNLLSAANSGRKADAPIKVLSVEDNEDYYIMLSSMFRNDPNVQFLNAGSLAAAGKLLSAPECCDVILLDHLLPDGNSFDLFALLKKMALDVPVVVITGQGDEVVASKVIKLGAADYLPKSDVTRENLSSCIHGALDQHRLKQDMNRTLKKMAEMATRDSLTGLRNQRYFLEAIEQETNRERRYKTGLSLCLIDVDYFKNINDTHGHSAGDFVLRELAEIMAQSVRTSDIVCRYGGEEFALIFPHTTAANAQYVCERFRRKAEDHIFHYEGKDLRITISTGIAGFPADGDETASTFFERADKNLYQAKANGRNQVCV
jgi:two-component system, cell cycle response regulator